MFIKRKQESEEQANKHKTALQTTNTELSKQAGLLVVLLMYNTMSSSCAITVFKYHFYIC